MALYRIYIDEVGNHDMEHADQPNHRFLSLTGVILESAYTLRVLQPEMNAIKQTFFQRDPDDPIIFHRKDLVNRRFAFHPLRDPEIERQFNATLLLALARWDYQVITVVIDKKEHRDRCQDWRRDPYHYGLQVLLDQYIHFLSGTGHSGDVMIESRGSNEDFKLRDAYTFLYDNGDDCLQATQWQACLTSCELKVKPKSANIAGLQLADLLAHPSRREVLIAHGLLIDERDIFGDRICAILQQSKYRRSCIGEMEDFGKIFLP